MLCLLASSSSSSSSSCSWSCGSSSCSMHLYAPFFSNYFQRHYMSTSTSIQCHQIDRSAIHMIHIDTWCMREWSACASHLNGASCVMYMVVTIWWRYITTEHVNVVKAIWLTNAVKVTWLLVFMFLCNFWKDRFGLDIAQHELHTCLKSK